MFNAYCCLVLDCEVVACEGDIFKSYTCNPFSDLPKASLDLCYPRTSSLWPLRKRVRFPSLLGPVNPLATHAD